jgi:hypothetical protein
MLNGQLHSKDLAPIPGGRLAKGAPQKSWLAMRYFIGKRTGNVWLRPTGPNSSYRTLATQVAYYQLYLAGRGPLAARPSYSNHGWAKACDIPTPQMQASVRTCGHLFGWGIAGGQLQSDAPTEQWHCTWRGPYNWRCRLWYARWLVASKRKAKRGKR